MPLLVSPRTCICNHWGKGNPTCSIGQGVYFVFVCAIQFSKKRDTAVVVCSFKGTCIWTSELKKLNGYCLCCFLLTRSKRTVGVVTWAIFYSIISNVHWQKILANYLHYCCSVCKNTANNCNVYTVRHCNSNILLHRSNPMCKASNVSQYTVVAL